MLIRFTDDQITIFIWSIIIIILGLMISDIIREDR